MITGKGTDGSGNPMLFLGLDDENTTRLMAGDPIMLGPQRLAALGFGPLTVVIHYRARMADLIDDATRLLGVVPEDGS